MYFACDFETTGLLAPSAAALEKQPHVVQAAWLVCDNDLNEQFGGSEYFKPPISIPAEVSEIHGITNEKVADCKAFRDFIPILLCTSKEMIWVGQNCPYDLGVLHHECRRYGIEFILPPSLDLMDYIVQRWGKRRKLGDVYFDLFGEKMLNAHDALADIKATVKCLKKMREN